MGFNCTFSALVSPSGIAVRIKAYLFVYVVLARNTEKKAQFILCADSPILKDDEVSSIFAQRVLKNVTSFG